MREFNGFYVLVIYLIEKYQMKSKSNKYPPRYQPIQSKSNKLAPRYQPLQSKSNTYVPQYQPLRPAVKRKLFEPYHGTGH